MASGDSEVTLIVTHIEEDGCTFSAQEQTPASIADLGNITIRLQSHAQSTGKKVDPFKVKHSLKGKVFASQYLDETWYRCRLLFPTGDAKYLVQYIDYGNCEEQQLSSLMDIPLDISDSVIPGLAERYRLHGIKVKEDHSAEAVEYIESSCTSLCMKAQVMKKASTHSSSPHSVIVFDENGKSIASILVDRGHAVEESNVKAKSNVVFSCPPVPQAQLFKNPLLSSPKPLSKFSLNNTLDVPALKLNNPSATMKNHSLNVASNSSWPSDVKNRAEKDRCTTSKEEAEKMRLDVIRLKLKLKETEKQVAELTRAKQYWRKKYEDLQQLINQPQSLEDQKSNTNISCANSTLSSFPEAEASLYMNSRFPSGTEHKKSLKYTTTSAVQTVIVKSTTENKKANVDDSCPPPLKQSVDHCIDRNGASFQTSPHSADPVGEMVQQLNYKSEDHVQPAQYNITSSVISPDAMSGFMRKLIMPALSYFKTLSNYNNTVKSCAAYEKELNDIVSKIKTRMDADGHCKEANRLGLTTRRHTVVENLKQSLQHTVQILAKDADEMDNIVARHTNGLHDIFSNFGDGNQGDAKDDIAVSDVEAFMKDVKMKTDLSALCKMIMNGLYQQLDTFILYKKRKGQFQQVYSDIAAYEGHERTIRDLSNENRGVRKHRQAIRMLVTEIKNLEEQIEDATPSELKDLEVQIPASLSRLSAERQQIHEGFEARWHLMSNLADMAEKFYPELLIEYKDLGISEYIKEEGIVMRGMEADHFDIKDKEGQDYLNAVVYSTEYRGDKISLHKCIIRNVALTQVVRRMSIYSNIECEYNLLPTGVFTSTEAAYVMVTKPPVDTIPVYKVETLNNEDVEIVLKDIAEALLSLHESGIAHGMVSKECILYSTNATDPHAFLSVPNFFTDQDSQTLANDVAQYGMLAKSLVLNNCPPKIETIISTCSKEAGNITMRNVLALF